MANNSEKIAEADHLHANGRYADAERLLYEIVGKNNGHWGAWHRLAATSLQLGKIEHAEKSARKAIELNSSIGSFHNRLAVVLKAAGKLDEAIETYKQGLTLSPRDAGGWYNFGNALRDKGDNEQASRCYQKAIVFRPDFCHAHHNLGNLLAGQDAPQAAMKCYDRALEISPRHDGVLVDKGNLLKDLNRDQKALVCYQKALEINPQSFSALSNMGNMTRSENRFEESLALFDKAIAINSKHPYTLNNRGITLAKLDRFAEAEASYRQALELKPAYANAFYNLGDLYTEQLQFDIARTYYEKALEADPKHPEAHFHLAQHYLRSGDFDRGWPLYEWRWKTREAKGHQHQYDFPMWDGSDLAGKTILLYTEQGAGDTLQFIRYAKLLKARQATVFVKCSARLIALLSRTEGIDRWFSNDEEIPKCDFYSPLLSLPLLLKTRVDSIPGECPYLFADPELQSQWRDTLYEIPGFRVGIAWQGSTTNLRDRTRSFPLKHFAPLADVPGVELLTLQKGQGAKQIAETSFRINDLAKELDKGSDGFVDTAAVMSKIDLVITSDTSIAHLAGGLGVPTWVALNDIPEWRWQMECEDTPWYPTMRVFRQRERGNWGELFERMATSLAELAAS